MTEFIEQPIKVYARIEDTIVKEMCSSVFVNYSEELTMIDSGYGDKYAHAQSHYLEKGLLDAKGRYNYKYIDGALIEISEEEKAILFPITEPQPTFEEMQTDINIEVDYRLSLLELGI